MNAVIEARKVREAALEGPLEELSAALARLSEAERQGRGAQQALRHLESAKDNWEAAHSAAWAEFEETMRKRTRHLPFNAPDGVDRRVAETEGSNEGDMS